MQLAPYFEASVPRIGQVNEDLSVFRWLNNYKGLTGRGGRYEKEGGIAVVPLYMHHIYFRFV
jgi:hypothetical protein